MVFVLHFVQVPLLFALGDLIVGYIKCCWALCFVDEIKREGKLDSSRKETRIRSDLIPS
jgi:hypothetical protein